MLMITTIFCLAQQGLSVTLPQWSVPASEGIDDYCLLASGNFSLLFPPLQDNLLGLSGNNTWVVPSNASAQVWKLFEIFSLCTWCLSGRVWWSGKWIKSALAWPSHWRGESSQHCDHQDGQISRDNRCLRQTSYRSWWERHERNVWSVWVCRYQYISLANQVRRYCSTKILSLHRYHYPRYGLSCPNSLMYPLYHAPITVNSPPALELELVTQEPMAYLLIKDIKLEVKLMGDVLRNVFYPFCVFRFSVIRHWLISILSLYPWSSTGEFGSASSTSVLTGHL